jgi:hypothetical protein
MRYHITHVSIGCVQNDFSACGTFAQTVHLSYVKISTTSNIDQNKRPLEPLHLGVPSGASKMISEPVVHLAQIVHLSCTNANTVSKWTEMRYHMTHVSIGCVQNDF